ncbi:MAG: hypothetical protein J1E63_01500, partial [Muribaculaceae bacterium]|nr:hypothetical protein [Muribaculaceae bacterium]
EHLQNACRVDDTNAKEAIACYYLGFYGYPEIEPEIADDLLNEVLDEGDNNALYYLGFLYEYFYQDRESATRCLERAIKLGVDGAERLLKQIQEDE